MPEDMPDRMPEDMSDRMPEDLPVRKCINVMVGITRSKVIFHPFGILSGTSPRLATSGGGPRGPAWDRPGDPWGHRDVRLFPGYLHEDGPEIFQYTASIFVYVQRMYIYIYVYIYIYCAHTQVYCKYSITVYVPVFFAEQRCDLRLFPTVSPCTPSDVQKKIALRGNAYF